MREKKAQKLMMKYLKKKGYNAAEKKKLISGNVDIFAEKDEEQWVIEVKGDYDKSSAQYNVNFQTLIGQISKHQTNEKRKYGIVIPITRTENGETLSYRRILTQYANSDFFEKNKINLFVIKDDESIQRIKPEMVKDYLQILTLVDEKKDMLLIKK